MPSPKKAVVAADPRQMMSTREVADYLRIKERKVYDLVHAKKIPCSRVTGKWLFPKRLIDLWVAQNTEYGDTKGRRSRPLIAAGSHDLLLDWALRESRCGLAQQTGGSLDGLKRLADGEAMLAGLHVIDSATGAYNVPAVREALGSEPVVMLRWVEREQGLLLAPGNPLRISGIADLARAEARVVLRQAEAGSHILLLRLLAAQKLALADLKRLPQPALNQNDLALAIVEGKADAGVAIRAVAKQFRLEFIPLHKESFDVVMHRDDYFEPPLQKLFAFARGPEFAARAAEFGGYDISELGKVVYNGE